MKRRKRFGILVGCVVGIGSGAWFMTRPPTVIEFIGGSPPGHVLLKSDVDGKALIDLPWFGGGRLRWPKDWLTVGKPYDEGLYAALFNWGTSKDPRQIRIRSGDIDYPVAMTEVFTVQETGSAHLMGESQFASVIPFATEEAYRNVELVSPDGSWKARLPVETKWGSSRRKTSTFKAGPNTITIRPQPWTLSTEALVFSVRADAPPNTYLLVDLNWFDEQGNRTQRTEERAWLLEGTEQTFSCFPRHLEGNVARGKVHELQAVPLQLKAVAANNFGGFTLATKDGQTIFGAGNGPMEKLGFMAVEVKGKWLSHYHPILRSTLKEFLFEGIRPGDSVEAVAYRAKQSWDYELALDAPPPIFEGNFRPYFDIPPAGQGVYKPVRVSR